MKNEALKGSLFVTLGACCYGMLGSFVKMAYRDGYTTGEVVVSQFSLGFISLLVLTFFSKQKQMPTQPQPNIKTKLRLIAAGTSLGLTSIFYYMAVRIVPVSIAIVLLMQTVSMSVILEMLMCKQRPGRRKIISASLVLGGTVLATQVLKLPAAISWLGLGWGLLAALSYTATMYSSNHVASNCPPFIRSLYMILGGLIIILLVFHSSISQGFPISIFWRWGLWVAMFGTILPPLLFTRGMPLTGMGLGAIIATIEIPIAVITAKILLSELVTYTQWFGIALIFAAVVYMNIPAHWRSYSLHEG